jgi:predicted PurR-regulated permease PerM
MEKREKKSSIPTPLGALIGYLLTVLILILSLKYFTILSAPVFFSFIIAYLFNPVVNYIEKKTRLSRGGAAALVIITLLLLFAFILVNLFPYMVDQLNMAAVKFPQTLQQFSQKMKVVSDYLTRNFSEYVGDFDLTEKIEEMLSSLLTDLSTIMVAAFTSLYGLLIVILYMVFMPLISYYFIKDARKIKQALVELIPVRLRPQVKMRIERVDLILSSFIRGQAIVVLILALLYSVGLTIIGLPFAILIGIMSGIGDIIPYFGTIVGLIVSLIVGITHFDSIEKLLLVLLVFGIVKGSENWFFYPKIVGKEVGLHFVWVLVSIVVFGKLFGFWGLLVAIPSAAGFKWHINDLITYYKNSHFFKKA